MDKAIIDFRKTTIPLNKIIEFMDKLAEAGIKVAEPIYNQETIPPYMFNSGIKFSSEIKVKSGEVVCKVSANGDDVLFLEFGAGINYGYGHPMALETGMMPGTYNPESDNWYRDGGWFFRYQGKLYRTEGNAPRMAMYKAFQEVVANINNIARSVFDD